MAGHGRAARTDATDISEHRRTCEFCKTRCLRRPLGSLALTCQGCRSCTHTSLGAYSFRTPVPKRCCRAPRSRPPVAEPNRLPTPAIDRFGCPTSDTRRLRSGSQQILSRSALDETRRCGPHKRQAKRCRAAQSLHRRLLPSRRDRPRRSRAAEKRDELAPPHVEHAESLAGIRAVYRKTRGGYFGTDLKYSESRWLPLAHVRRWVIHVVSAMSATCPLYPQSLPWMLQRGDRSERCHKRHFDVSR